MSTQSVLVRNWRCVVDGAELLLAAAFRASGLREMAHRAHQLVEPSLAHLTGQVTDIYATDWLLAESMN